jgi:hypothetical protein
MQQIDVGGGSSLARTDLVLCAGVEKAPDLVFKRHLAQGIASISRREGLPARFDEAVASRVFLNWIDALMAQKVYSDVNRRDYIMFGAGILLKTLIEERSIRLMLTSRPTSAGASLATIWPDGYLATSYCLSVLDAVLEQEQLPGFTLNPAAETLSIWESFRENVSEDPRLAIAYLDLFIGNEPNWTQPTWAGIERGVARRPAERAQIRRIGVRDCGQFTINAPALARERQVLDATIARVGFAREPMSSLQAYHRSADLGLVH